jgi:GTPase
VLHQRPSYDASGHVAEVHLRRVPEEQHFIDVRVLFLGDSAAGKSTLIAVLGSGVLEKEAGAARLNLFRYAD